MGLNTSEVHYSSAETEAYNLGLAPAFVANIRQERNELTSPFPLVADLGLSRTIQAGRTATEIGNAPVQNSGRSVPDGSFRA